MARKQKKQKKDRNADLSPDLVYKKRALRLSIGVWFGVTIVMLAITIAVIQAGPFGLDLTVAANQTHAQEEVRDFSDALMGGLGFAWMIVAILPAVLYYRFAVKRWLPSRRQTPPAAPAELPAASLP